MYIGETHCQQVLDDIVDNLFSLAVCDDLPQVVETLEVEVLHDDGAVRTAVGGRRRHDCRRRSHSRLLQGAGCHVDALEVGLEAAEPFGTHLGRFPLQKHFL